MDIWKYFDITHRFHIICNPTSIEKYSHFISLLRLSPGSRVLEIAAGKGEFITQCAERYQVSGVAIDKSPYCIRDAQEKLQSRIPGAPIEFLLMDGADYQPETPGSFDLSACMGASWVFGGHEGTLRYLKKQTRPGGLIAVGEPYWIQDPPPEFLQAIGESKEAFSTHAGNVSIGEQMGLKLIYTAVSNHDEWDMYEGLQWYGVDQYIQQNPEDTDLPELIDRVEKSKQNYLVWGRDIFGWAMYLFRC